MVWREVLDLVFGTNNVAIYLKATVPGETLDYIYECNVKTELLVRVRIGQDG